MRLTPNGLRRIALSIAVLVGALALAEIAVRLFVSVGYRRSVPHDTSFPWASLVHRKSSVPGLLYELDPGAEADVKGIHVAIDQLGLRGPEIAPEKPRGWLRIAAIGDSVTFGFGVQVEDAWPSVLERMLNEQASADGPRYQVLDFAVGGYSSRDEAIVVREKALALDPDLVIVGYFLNDPDNEPVQPLLMYFHEPEWWEHLSILRLVAGWRREHEFRTLGDGDPFLAFHASEGREWPTVPAAFDAIRAATSARNVHVLLVTFPAFRPTHTWEDYPYLAQHAQVLAAAAERGFDTLDVRPEFAKSGKTVVELANDNDHPNAIGHRIAAAAICARIRSAHARLFEGRNGLSR